MSCCVPEDPKPGQTKKPMSLRRQSVTCTIRLLITQRSQIQILSPLRLRALLAAATIEARDPAAQ
jgi:hypothetical protein